MTRHSVTFCMGLIWRPIKYPQPTDGVNLAMWSICGRSMIEFRLWAVIWASVGKAIGFTPEGGHQ